MFEPQEIVRTKSTCRGLNAQETSPPKFSLRLQQVRTSTSLSHESTAPLAACYVKDSLLGFLFLMPHNSQTHDVSSHSLLEQKDGESFRYGGVNAREQSIFL